MARVLHGPERWYKSQSAAAYRRFEAEHRQLRAWEWATVVAAVSLFALSFAVFCSKSVAFLWGAR